MNCPKCKGETGICYGSNRADGTFRRKRRCRACGYEFATREVAEDELREFLLAKNPDVKRRGCFADSLCWRCARATGFCSWSREFEPVQGWEAEKTVIKSYYETIESYDVIKCPLFEEDKRKE